VIDWNKDKIDDLVVSAPRVNADQLAYTGLVYIYLGSKSSGVSPNSLSAVITTGYSRNTTIGNFATLGSTLLGADVNGGTCPTPAAPDPPLTST